jgi:hypothetical protein
MVSHLDELFLFVVRVGEEIHSSGCQSSVPALFVVPRGDEHDRHRIADDTFSELLQRTKSIHAGHLDIEQSEVRVMLRGEAPASSPDAAVMTE